MFPKVSRSIPVLVPPELAKSTGISTIQVNMVLICAVLLVRARHISVLVDQYEQGQKNFHHQEQESYEDVGIESILGDDLLRVSFDDGRNPAK